MLTGDRVTLRPFATSDVEAIWYWYADHEFSTLDGNVYGASRESIAAMVASFGTPSFADVSLGICAEDSELIGLVRLKRALPEDRSADFGIAIAREQWNRGYGTDATRTMLKFAFDEMNLHRVALGVLDYNERARRCYQKCGFREEGRAREAKYRNGSWCDDIQMAILSHEWGAALEPTRSDTRT